MRKSERRESGKKQKLEIPNVGVGINEVRLRAGKERLEKGVFSIRLHSFHRTK